MISEALRAARWPQVIARVIEPVIWPPAANLWLTLPAWDGHFYCYIDPTLRQERTVFATMESRR
jgi:hypothetical protein